jgi:dethiobiotin synthetase/adenosylmethionine--8-amino-7-oxononanoate aminotransferase
LIGDSRLGGISSTISAYESLLLRGYIVDALLLFREDYYQNWEYLTSYFAEKGIPVTAIPPPPARSSSPEEDVTNLESYYKGVSQSKSSGLSGVIAQLTERHKSRIDELNSMAARTQTQIWWPFVQHSSVRPDSKSIAVIDSAHKDLFSVYSDHDLTIPTRYWILNSMDRHPGGLKPSVIPTPPSRSQQPAQLVDTGMSSSLNLPTSPL